MANIITNNAAIHSIEKKDCFNSTSETSTVKGYATIIKIKTNIGPSQPLDFFNSFRNSNLITCMA